MSKETKYDKLALALLAKIDNDEYFLFEDAEVPERDLSQFLKELLEQADE